MVGEWVGGWVGGGVRGQGWVGRRKTHEYMFRVAMNPRSNYYI